MGEFMIFFLVIIACAVQYFLSTRHSVYWGAIVPVLFLTGMTWMFITNRIESIIAFLILLVVGMIFLIEQWSRGRKSLKKNRSKELDKMKKLDIE
ncbi:hypothetical protein [Oceanobacillus halophilus]|uniref:Uncharacterized protein n=1 Tax=Oceanobacillus halophilus TaxID=930130 RepID=A0A494ZWF3_9BACI|nr:hypothetical protein [Oceanobacillus halophilus]RKQ30244.1 hypothetical protein D8M06_16265 [Oceanobacillus halophilus]